MAPACALADEPGATWKTEYERGKKALSTRDYAEAMARFRASLADAEATPGNESGVIDVLRACSQGSRLQRRFEEAEEFLSRAAVLVAKQHGETSLELAALLSELAVVARSSGNRREALASLEKAIRIREGHPEAKPEDIAKDVTEAGLSQAGLGDTKSAKDTLHRALSLWATAAPPDSPQLLPVLDALGVIYRDGAEYGEAEAVFLRALTIRELLLGPDSSELLSTLDSLAYVYFGQKKFSEAGPVYKRLLALWESSAGQEHPMVALTLDKMAEFYAFQQQYDEADAAASRALAMRTNMHIASLNQTGRILLMEANLQPAEDHYRRAIAIGDLAKATDDVLDPLLRVYGKVLRVLDRPQEAAAVEKRATDALIQKADREGRRPSPVRVP